jgi:ADP-L-glycero-D-manno-heptose 6-epimerase
LFKSYRPEYDHGGQLRDFVWVQDCVDVILWLLDHPNLSGMLLNVGSGHARSFNDLARSVFAAMDEQARIEYIDMPVTLQGAYQYETCADLSTLRALGYTSPMTSLEQGVRMYVQEYMMQPDQYR